MKAVVAAIVIGLAAVIVVQSLRVSKLRAENEALRQQVSATQAQADTMENSTAPPSATAASEEDRTELLRLRNQAAQLKQATNEAQQLRAQVQQLQAAQAAQTRAAAAGLAELAPPAATPTSAAVPRESWAFVGYGTPEAALQSALFSMSQGDYQTFLASLAPEEAQRMQRSFEGKTPEQISQEGQRDMAKVKSFQVLNREELAPDRVMLNVYAGGEDRVQKIMMQKFGEEWKMSGKARRGEQSQSPAPAPVPPPLQ